MSPQPILLQLRTAVAQSEGARQARKKEKEKRLAANRGKKKRKNFILRDLKLIEQFTLVDAMRYVIER